MALRHGLLDAEEVWAAAHVDEDHNIAMWGEVEEITERRAKRRRDFDAAVRLMGLVGVGGLPLIGRCAPPSPRTGRSH